MLHDPDALRAPTVDVSGRRRWLYPDRRSGRLSRLRKKLAFVLIAIYIVAPFISVNGHPLIRFDVLEAVVFLGGESFQFSEGFYLAFVFSGLALLLGFVTSLWGRVWCGYACPQTVFIEWIIRPIEEFIEGPALRRKKQDNGPLTFTRIRQKTLKYMIYAIFIASISNVLLAYFIDPFLLWHWMRQSPVEHPLAFGIMLLTFAALFFDLVWFRDQFCSFLCPYARFQSVMIGRATPTIAFDAKRGEPRGKKAGSGDCIDCQLCVRVCPTGIDIRNGLQLECIQCGRCADACDGIMKNLGRPLGLIRTASEVELEGQVKRRLRLRPSIYFLLLLANIGIVSLLVGTRDPIKMTLMRQPGTTYARINENELANYYILRVSNQSQQKQMFNVHANDAIRLICSLCTQMLEPHKEVKGSLVVIFPENFANQEVVIEQNGELIRVPLLKPE